MRGKQLQSFTSESERGSYNSYGAAAHSTEVTVSTRNTLTREGGERGHKPNLNILRHGTNSTIPSFLGVEKMELSLWART